MPPALSKRSSDPKIKDGLPCSEPNCGKQFEYISSYTRHLKSVHKIAPDLAQAQGDEMKKKLFDDKLATFNEQRKCPECKANFWVMVIFLDPKFFSSSNIRFLGEHGHPSEERAPNTQPG